MINFLFWLFTVGHRLFYHLYKQDIRHIPHYVALVLPPTLYNSWNILLNLTLYKTDYLGGKNVSILPILHIWCRILDLRSSLFPTSLKIFFHCLLGTGFAKTTKKQIAVWLHYIWGTFTFLLESCAFLIFLWIRDFYLSVLLCVCFWSVF